MRLLNVNGLRFKQLKLATLSLFTVFLLWQWENGSLYSTDLLLLESLALSHPADSQFIDQRASAEKDFSSADPLARSAAEVGEEVTAAPPPLSIVGNTEEVAVRKEAAPPEKKGTENGFLMTSGHYILVSDVKDGSLRAGHAD